VSKRGKTHSNQPGVTHAVSEFDNPRNKPSMGKGPAAAASKPHVPAEAGAPAEDKPFGRKAARRGRIANLLKKARGKA
jgi:hypothetical protein